MKLTDEFIPPACDYPVCIGGECTYECERSERSRKYWDDEMAELRAALEGEK